MSSRRSSRAAAAACAAAPGPGCQRGAPNALPTTHSQLRTTRAPAHRARSRSRGQTLLLFALTLLLLVLMVCLTLSVSMRIRDRMETQHVADLTAWTNAVATARAFNAIALMRRAQTAHLVALAGVESIISWTSMTRAQLEASQLALAGCPAGAAALEAIEVRDATLSARWHELDAAAGTQAINIQILGFYLLSMQRQLTYSTDGAGGFNEGQLARRITGGQGSYGELMVQLATGNTRERLERSGLRSVPLTGTLDVPLRELIWSTTGGTSYGLDMAMATRGYSFITSRRGNAQTSVAGEIQAILGGVGGTVTFSGGGGSTYWGLSRGHGGPPDRVDFTWAEDHGPVTIAVPGCPTVTVPGWAFVKSTDLNDTTDDHQWYPAGEDPGMEKQYRHTLLPCTGPGCPATFISGMNYRVGEWRNADDAFAQPKNYAVVQRDYSRRDPMPWELFFRFHFVPDGPGQRFDNRGLYLRDGTEVSRQTALATGMAYYHRRGHWQEPPSLWNPFWRATLVPADVDLTGDARRGGGDVPATLEQAQAPWAAEAYRALAGAGFRGTH